MEASPQIVRKLPWLIEEVNLDPKTSKLERTKPKIIAAIPAYNEERFIGSVVLKAKKYVDEVIVVDDGSTDKTTQLAQEAGAYVIRHEFNKGYGESIKSCFRVAKSHNVDVLITLDGDKQHNPEEIPTLLFPLMSGAVDLTIGSRFLSDGNDIPRYRKFGIKVITFLFNFASSTKVSDAQSGFRAYKRKVLDSFSLTEKGMGVSVQTLIEARGNHFTPQEVPIHCDYHKGSSTLNPVYHGLSVAFTTVKLRFMHQWHNLLSKLAFSVNLQRFNTHRSFK